MKPSAQTKWSDDGGQKRTNRQKRKSILLMVCMVAPVVAMTGTALGQDTPYWTPAEYAQPFAPFPLHEMVERYGVTDTLQIYDQLQREQEARRQLEEIQHAQRRDRELRKKVVELANTSYQLYQRLNNPSVTHADTPELAKRCEKLAKAIRKLLR